MDKILIRSMWSVLFSIISLCSSSVAIDTRADFVHALLHDYDSRLQPNFEQDTFTEIDVGLYINNIDSISEQTMDQKMNLFIEQEWVDQRLQFYGLINAPYLELDSKLMDLIWVPDLYIRNEKSASFHDVTVPNKMLHLYADGRIVYRLRASITASCPMQLHKYPMDSQMCSVFIQSFAFTKNNLRFRWRKDKPISINQNLELPQFVLQKTEVSDCEPSCDETTGNFTCIRMDMYYSRNIGYYMIQIYIPTILIVLLSWVSFWLSIDAVPARISLGILTVLTLTNQKTNLASSVPHVSYVKALDIWLAVCLCFVFAAMLEYALVNVMEREAKDKPMEKLLEKEKSDQEPGIIRKRRSGAKIDKISRIAFPAMFALFCILYWLAYII